jgi:hypothetical protein
VRLFTIAIAYSSDVTSPGPSLVRRGDLHAFPLLTKEGVRGRFDRLNVMVLVKQDTQ